MNIGIYIDYMSDTAKLEKVSNFVNDSLNNEAVSDTSIFYDNIGYNPFDTRCGLFNSTELWSFNGNLIVMSLECLNTSINIINNINLFYYYGWEEKLNILNLLKCLNINQNINIICKTEENANELYRTTGKRAIGISENFTNILEILSRCKDEYKSDNNDVYKAA